jgi:hypothetical protein
MEESNGCQSCHRSETLQIKSIYSKLAKLDYFYQIFKFWQKFNLTVISSSGSICVKLIKERMKLEWISHYKHAPKLTQNTFKNNLSDN